MKEMLLEDLKFAGYALGVYAVAIGSYWLFVA